MPAERIYVFDACALLGLLHQEEGAEVVASLLEETGSRRLIHAVNACEVYYDVHRRSGEKAAGDLHGLLLRMGLVIDPSLSPDFWQAAGRIKSVWRRISLADCFALTLAIQEGGTLITSDHHEMDAVAASKLCPIRFIR